MRHGSPSCNNNASSRVSGTSLLCRPFLQGPHTTCANWWMTSRSGTTPAWSGRRRVCRAPGGPLPTVVPFGPPNLPVFVAPGKERNLSRSTPNTNPKRHSFLLLEPLLHQRLHHSGNPALPASGCPGVGPIAVTDPNILALSSGPPENEIELWDASTGNQVATFHGQPHRVGCVPDLPPVCVGLLHPRTMPWLQRTVMGLHTRDQTCISQPHCLGFFFIIVHYSSSSIPESCST